MTHFPCYTDEKTEKYKDTFFLLNQVIQKKSQHHQIITSIFDNNEDDYDMTREDIMLPKVFGIPHMSVWGIWATSPWLWKGK